MKIISLIFIGRYKSFVAYKEFLSHILHLIQTPDASMCYSNFIKTSFLFALSFVMTQMVLIISFKLKRVSILEDKMAISSVNEVYILSNENYETHFLIHSTTKYQVSNVNYF